MLGEMRYDNRRLSLSTQLETESRVTRHVSVRDP